VDKPALHDRPGGYDLITAIANDQLPHPPAAPCRIAIGRSGKYLVTEAADEGKEGQMKSKILSWFKSPAKDVQSDGPYESHYENGQLKSKGSYKDGQQDGACESYYENGQLQSKGNHTDGQRNGLQEWFHKNGQLRERQPYKHGKQDGLWEFFHENGQLKSTPL